MLYVWYSLIHSLLNLCMDDVCVFVCSRVSLKMDMCCYMGTVEVRGQPQVPFLTFHLVWDKVSCWSHWVPQAVWPKSIWGFSCLSLSVCKSIGIIAGTLVHGFLHAFWGSKGRISHKPGKSFTKWAFSLLINVSVPSTNIQSCQASPSANQEREETHCERKTQRDDKTWKPAGRSAHPGAGAQQVGHPCKNFRSPIWQRVHMAIHAQLSLRDACLNQQASH